MVVAMKHVLGAMLLLSGSYDRTVRCWDFDSGECVRTFGGHQRAVFCLVYLPADSCSDSGNDDTTSLQVPYSMLLAHSLPFL